MRFTDLTGKKFGKLTVVKRSYPNSKTNHCCIHCNRAKNSMTLPEFKELITRIYKKVIE